MRVKLEDVCERGSSNLKQSDVIDKTGAYPIYGAAGYIGNVDFYHQDKPYVAVVKDGAGIGRTTLLPANSSVIGTMQLISVISLSIKGPSKVREEDSSLVFKRET